MSAQTTPVAGPERRTRRRWALSVLPTGALVVVLLYVAMALLAPMLTEHSPVEVFPDQILSPPSVDHPFGTDRNGMDVLSRTVHAARLDLGITVSGVSGALLVGSVLGLLLGYVGGWVDVVVTRVLDILQAVPLLIMALAILAASRNSPVAVAAVIAFVYAPIMTRVVRAETLVLKHTPFVQAARAVGNSDLRIMWRHILPAAGGPVVVQTAIRLAFAIKVTAALAFVGVGIVPPTPEWGGMIRLGTDDILRGIWWTSLFPGLAVTALVLSLTVLADGLQELFDPKTRRR